MLLNKECRYCKNWNRNGYIDKLGIEWGICKIIIDKIRTCAYNAKCQSPNLFIERFKGISNAEINILHDFLDKPYKKNETFDNYDYYLSLGKKEKEDIIVGGNTKFCEMCQQLPVHCICRKKNIQFLNARQEKMQQAKKATANSKLKFPGEEKEGFAPCNHFLKDAHNKCMLCGEIIKEEEEIMGNENCKHSYLDNNWQCRYCGKRVENPISNNQPKQTTKKELLLNLEKIIFDKNLTIEQGFCLIAEQNKWIEEEKSALEMAREYNPKCVAPNGGICPLMAEQKKRYEQAIKELEKKQ